MKRYDFDTCIDRRGTACEKYEDLMTIFGTDRVIPLWIADMDFATADFIVEAMHKRMWNMARKLKITGNEKYTL